MPKFAVDLETRMARNSVNAKANVASIKAVVKKSMALGHGIAGAKEKSKSDLR